jgi:hypothetical protein
MHNSRLVPYTGNDADFIHQQTFPMPRPGMGKKGFFGTRPQAMDLGFRENPQDMVFAQVIPVDM